LCNGKTLAFQAKDAGSIPAARSRNTTIDEFYIGCCEAWSIGLAWVQIVIDLLLTGARRAIF
jgi:hypothetical protein